MSKASTLAIIDQLKQNNEDLEWFPTTDEMIEVIAQDLEKVNFVKNGWDDFKSLLDIGCGDGRVLQYLNNYEKKNGSVNDKYLPFKYFGIEKAQVHLSNLAKSDSISIIGTDFWQTGLMDKQMDVIFCNPPYSEFNQWVERVLKEGYASVFYFVIPDRWVNNSYIATVIKDRGMRSDIIYSGDFLGGDRQARAKINIVRVGFKKYYREYRSSFRDIQELDYPLMCNRGYTDTENDPFSSWFDGLFSIDIDQSTNETEQEKKDKCKEVFAKSNTIQELADWYNKDLSEIQENYNNLAKLDHSIFKELGVDLNTLKVGLKNRLSGLKQGYWKNFINFYDPIVNRLTSKKREELFESMLSNVSTLDFTVGNMLFITDKAISKVNDYIEDQVKDLYIMLANQENILQYKSNQKVFDSHNWRYNNYKDPYKLDYRIITTGVSGNSWLTPRMYNIFDRLNDIVIVLKSLGYNVSIPEAFKNDNNPVPFGEKLYFMENNLTTGKDDIAFEAKFYRNGNCHLKFRKDIMLNFNVVAGRLFGWLTSAEQATEELNESPKEVMQYWNQSLSLGISNKTTLIGLPKFD